MKEYWQKIISWWQQLAIREQRVLMIGGACLGVFIIYQFIWSASIDHLNLMRHQIQTQEKTLISLQVADKEIRQLEEQASHNQSSVNIPHADGVLLLSYLQKQINIESLRQTSEDTVEIHLQGIAFDQFIRLMMRVVKEQSVSISLLIITPESTPGMVDARVVLKTR